MRLFKTVILLVAAFALTFGAVTDAKAVSWPAGADFTNLAAFLVGEGADATFVSPLATPSTMRVTALAYEAGYENAFIESGTTLFTNRVGTSPTAFGTWKYIDPTKSKFTIDTTGTPSDRTFDWTASHIQVYQLNKDWTYAALGQTFEAGTYIFGLDDGGAGPDDNHDDFIMAASVPIPGAVWLLGAGVIGLAGLRRKLRS